MTEPITALVAAPGPASPQTTLQTTQLVRHLMWHKALADFDEDTSHIDGYIGLVQQTGEGEHVSIRDPFQRDVAIAFELVIQEHLDPWDLDLSKFADLYLKESRARGVDIVTAGRIILMAWTVLKLQSDEVAERATHVEQAQEFGWDDIPDWDYSDDEWDYTDRVKQAPVAPIDEKVRHKGDRRVTLMELLGAFEEVHEEAIERTKLEASKQKARLSLKRKMRGRVGGMVHKEDLEAEIAETWQRIREHPSSPVPFSELHEDDAVDLVQCFNAILFLAKQRRIDLDQPEFPRGEIWIKPLLLDAAEETESTPTELESGQDGVAVPTEAVEASSSNNSTGDGPAPEPSRNHQSEVTHET